MCDGKEFSQFSPFTVLTRTHHDFFSDKHVDHYQPVIVKL